MRATELLEKIGNRLQIKLVLPPQLALSRWQAQAAELPARCRERLAQAIGLGDLEGIRRSLTELGQHPTFAELGEHLRRLLDDFDLEAMRELIAPADAES